MLWSMRLSSRCPDRDWTNRRSRTTSRRQPQSHRDLAAQLRIGGLPDLAHAALAEESGDAVVADRGARAEGHELLGRLPSHSTPTRSTGPPSGTEVPRKGVRTHCQRVWRAARPQGRFWRVGGLTSRTCASWRNQRDAAGLGGVGPTGVVEKHSISGHSIHPDDPAETGAFRGESRLDRIGVSGTPSETLIGTGNRWADDPVSRTAQRA